MCFWAVDYSSFRTVLDMFLDMLFSSYMNLPQVGKATYSTDLITGPFIEYPWSQTSKPGKNVVIVISRWAQLMMHSDGP